MKMYEFVEKANKKKSTQTHENGGVLQLNRHVIVY